ncbi:relaxase/mobilization nuclease domain-containing protein [Salinarimonas rosea]|uniref:relaxase/mobilization nuclease domain-containing protein n=1 Tax=Salinarimonas rosea TaxID=552063 RepID=UPI00069407BC|nr:relaxase/mobilization nuclease domain-containing protein [Salinarimonas rosea]
MILKGNQRSGGEDLASHLMNIYDNDAMELASVRGTIAQDLHGAFAEFEAMATGTRCKQSLYSLSINPSEPMSRAQYETAIERIEDRLGLNGQPRAVVFHVKEGREHCHVVWSRIDTVQMKAVQLSHDRQKLRSVAQELAQEFGHELPDGLAKNRGAQRYDQIDQAVKTAELAQAELSGLDATHRRAEITAAYEGSDSAQSFVDALWERGYQLARGDKRGFVVVDRAGQVHSLARQVNGARAKDVQARLSPLTPDDLPTVKETRERIRQEIEDEALDHHRAPHVKRSPEELKARQAERRGKLLAERQELELRQRQERMSLHTAQKKEAERPFARAASAVLALFGRVPVLRSVLAPLYRNTNLNMAERHRLEEEALSRRYGRENANLVRREQALGRVEARENRSLARDQRRVAQHEELQQRKAAGEKLGQVAENAADVTRPRTDEQPKQKAADKQAARPRRPRGYGLRRDP